MAHPRLLVWRRDRRAVPRADMGDSGGGARTEAQSTFAADIAALSEPAGYFDTDNLISNERSYLDVRAGAEGARTSRAALTSASDPIRTSPTSPRSGPTSPSSSTSGATICLLHLLFKSLFSLARTRVEYLALLLGRQVPADLESWRARAPSSAS